MPDTEVPLPPIVGKPGYTTTEFWLTVIPVVSSLLTLLFKSDWGLSADQVGFATLAAGFAAAVYSIARALTKRGTHAAIAEAYHAAALGTAVEDVPHAP